MRNVALILMVITTVMFAAEQVPLQNPVFEVASVKAHTSERVNLPPITPAPNRFSANNATLKTILQFAYYTPDGRPLRMVDIIGAPPWADTDGFDIQATTQREIPQEQMRLMVQSLLAERFQLKTHWEPREMNVYNMVIAKDASKLKSAESGNNPERLIAMPSPSGITLTFTNEAMSMAQFAGWLQSYAGRPVLDKTGVTEFFNLRLQFQTEVRNTSAGAGGQEPPLPADPSGPSVFTALQEQLGLKLEPSKATLEVLAVDRVQKPSEN